MKQIYALLARLKLAALASLVKLPEVVGYLDGKLSHGGGLVSVRRGPLPLRGARHFAYVYGPCALPGSGPGGAER